MQICKQCGSALADEDFRLYSKRGKGERQTTVGRHTICLFCESLDARARVLLQQEKAGKSSTELKLEIESLKHYFQALMDAGFPPVTSAVRELLGIVKKEAHVPYNAAKKRREDFMKDVLFMHGVGIPVEEQAKMHRDKVLKRGYASADEAYEKHKTLVDTLKVMGLYDEVNESLEGWFDE